MLRAYAFLDFIRAAELNLSFLRQLEYENERNLGVRVRNADYRCGNAYEETEKINIFVGSLCPMIRTIVAWHLENVQKPMVNFDNMVQYDISEGDACCARQKYMTDGCSSGLRPKVRGSLPWKQRSLYRCDAMEVPRNATSSSFQVGVFNAQRSFCVTLATNVVSCRRITSCLSWNWRRSSRTTMT